MGQDVGFERGGYLASAFPVRVGLGVSVPPQLGQVPLRSLSLHAVQKVHSKEQISAPSASAGKGSPQRSQSGRMSNMTG